MRRRGRVPANAASVPDIEAVTYVALGVDGLQQPVPHLLRRRRSRCHCLSQAGGAAGPEGGQAEAGDAGQSLAGLRERSRMFPAAPEEVGALGEMAEDGGKRRGPELRPRTTAAATAEQGGGGGADGGAAANTAASRTKLQ